MTLNLYQKTAITTVIATLVLIFVGGLVRASGAGLGCPDWPQCFGMWIPPTSAAELPPQYDASLFNPLHTWLEYINRLVGVLIGLFITATFLISFRYRKSDPVITAFSGLAFVLVIFQAWLGGQVVRSGLSAGMITIHMLMAMTILAVLLYASFRAMNSRLISPISPSTRKTLLWVSGGILFFTLIQMVLGTQVREEVDVAKNVLELPREGWIEHLGFIYEIHRSFSWLVVILSGALIYFNRKLNVPGRLSKLGWIIGVLVLLQVIAGIGLERLLMPGALQVVHLTGVAVLICAELLYLLIAVFSKKT
ncbi:COX15/CtaA family protein [Rhodohalobacter mucosus]|uniref:Heme A synthase n=1 Tax=Rhodohalobacter mucosus TaxID=2079485 RepID=A0A316TT82_9BACT|nr:COX15/CtaA family protein [Rhodohalobacter mucosus]PWN06175.1 heme A synthase [Rhodohalobacter mucosus]